MSLSPSQFRFGRILMLAFLAILLQRDAADLLSAGARTDLRLSGEVLAVAICVVWGWFWLRVAGAADRLRPTIAVVALLVLVTAFTVSDPNRSYPFYYPYYYCAIVAGAAYGWRLSLPALALIVGAATLVVASLHGRGVVALDLITVMTVLGLGAIAVRRHVSNFVQLQIARDEIRRLAVAEERLRLARDLHDQLGQSLSTVVLHSELVALELPADAPEATRARVRSVVDTARSALVSMRAVVDGYRQPELAEELEEARAILEASGIRCRIEGPPSALPAAPAATLAWAVREGVTNIIRHSSAHHAVVEVSRENGAARLRVEDDGDGTAALADGTPALTDGNGLSGLRERAAALGGRLELRSRPGKGFELLIELPVKA